MSKRENLTRWDALFGPKKIDRMLGSRDSTIMWSFGKVLLGLTIGFAGVSQDELVLNGAGLGLGGLLIYSGILGIAKNSREYSQIADISDGHSQWTR